MEKTVIRSSFLFAITRLIFANECLQTFPECVCLFKNKDVYVKELLGSNYNLDTFKLLVDEFQPPKLLGTINCSSKSFSLIPNFKQVKNLDAKKNLQINSLDLTKNNLTLINANAFYDINSLISIDLSSNYISKISHKAFNGIFNHLISLKLNSNQLLSVTTFPIYFASKISSLKALFLASNLLDTLIDRSFQSIFSAWLKFLDLSNNSISCIYEDAFIGLHSLEYLNLCNNRIGLEIINKEKCSKTNYLIRILKHLKAIQNLQLCSNGFDSLNSDPQIFKNNTKIRTINLEKNKINSLNNFFCVNDTQLSNKNGKILSFYHLFSLYFKSQKINARS